jgi:hypothetical protein
VSNLKVVPAPEAPLSPSGLDHFDGLLDKLSDALGDLLDLSGVHHDDIRGFVGRVLASGSRLVFTHRREPLFNERPAG